MSALTPPAPETMQFRYPCGCFYVFAHGAHLKSVIIEAWSHCNDHEAQFQAFREVD